MLAHWSYFLVEDSVRLSWRVPFWFSVVLGPTSPRQNWGEFYRDNHDLRNRGAPYTTGMCADFLGGLVSTQAEPRAANIRLGVRAVWNECCKTRAAYKWEPLNRVILQSGRLLLPPPPRGSHSEGNLSNSQNLSAVCEARGHQGSLFLSTLGSLKSTVTQYLLDGWVRLGP